MRRALAVALLAAGLAAAPGCAPRESGIDAVRARAHVEMLAGTIGRRPTGSPANARARVYLVDQLTTLGFAVRLQEVDAVNERDGLTAHVINIIGVRNGVRDEAIALVAHYDTVPDAPGALDNALAVGTTIEAARALIAAPGLTHSLIVAFTDGEELNLMGARALVKDVEVRRRARAWLNFDGTGADGPPVMYETTGGDALTAWARHAVAPRGASWTIEIYKRLPNDTDFTIFKPLGMTGVNVATVSDAYPYHTDRDLPARLTDRAIANEGDNTVATVRALDRTALDPTAELPTYFDVAGRFTVMYGRAILRNLTDLALVAGGTAWLSMVVLVWRQDRPRTLLLTIVWAVIASGAGVAASLGPVVALRAFRAERHPWYAHPDPMLTAVAASGLLAGWIVLTLARRVPLRFRPSWSPASAWIVTLPLWIALTILANRAAPQITFLFILPILAAAVPIAIPFGRPGSIVAAAVLSGVCVAFLWWPNLALLVRFVVPMFGWLPVVTPGFVYPVLVIAAAIMTLPSCLVMLAALPAGDRTERVHALTGAALLVFLLGAAALATTADAYTPERPLRRSVRYVQDQVTGRAWWEIAANEPGLDVGPAGPAPGSWHATSDPLPGGTPIQPLTGPFRSWTETKPVIEQAPVDLRLARQADRPGQRRWDLTIVPHDHLAVRVSLPRGVVPLASSVTGTMSAGVWTATYVAVPPAGLTISLTLPEAGDTLDATVTCITDHLPGAPLNGRLPPWLTTTRTAWSARSWYVLGTRDAAGRAASTTATPSAPPGRSP